MEANLTTLQNVTSHPMGNRAEKFGKKTCIFQIQNQLELEIAELQIEPILEPAWQEQG